MAKTDWQEGDDISPARLNTLGVEINTLSLHVDNLQDDVDALTFDNESEGITWYTNYAAFPLTGVTDHMYGSRATNEVFRWTGSTYAEFVTAFTAASTDILTNKTIDLAANTVTMTVAELNTAVSDGNVATLGGAETLAGKAISLASNTVTGTTAEFNTALSDGDFATLAGAEALTNKTLTAPALGGAAVAAQSATLAFHNQADQTTNYERLRLFWSSNVATVASENGGSGTARALQLLAGGSKTITIAGAAAQFDFAASTSGAAPLVKIAGTQSQSATGLTGITIAPTINQSSTAGYTMLLINPTHSATGSGTKLLLDLQLGSTTKFNIDTAGVVTHADGGNLVFGTSTGSKIGTATSQMIGFWNATPIVQPTTGVTAATFTANSGTTVNDASTFDGYTIGKVVKALRNAGLLA